MLYRPHFTHLSVDSGRSPIERSPMNGGRTLNAIRGNRAEGNLLIASATMRNQARAMAEFGSAYNIDCKFVNPKDT